MTGGATDLLIVDGAGAGVHITPAANEVGSEQFTFTTDGPSVIADLALLSPDLTFPYFDLSVDGCNGGSAHGGGALLARGPGATILEGIGIEQDLFERSATNAKPAFTRCRSEMHR